MEIMEIRHITYTGASLVLLKSRAISFDYIQNLVTPTMLPTSSLKLMAILMLG